MPRKLVIRFILKLDADGGSDRSWLLGFFNRKLLIRAIKLLRAYQALIKEDHADGEI